MSHYEDEAQLEQLKQWWHENWKALATGLALGLGGIFGWQGWQGHEQKVAAQAAQAFQDLKVAAEAGKTDETAKLAQQLMKTRGGTPYAAQAALRLAQLQVADGKLDEAATQLKWVLDRSSDDGLKHVARLRLARVLWQQKKLDEALQQLEVKDAGSFEPLYQELRGDIKLAQGDRKAALEAYRNALKGPPGGTSANIQEKLDDLADVARAAS
jgi:predicted negative regulator of RcsB-dependent stress response